MNKVTFPAQARNFLLLLVGILCTQIITAQTAQTELRKTEPVKKQIVEPGNSTTNVVDLSLSATPAGLVHIDPNHPPVRHARNISVYDVRKNNQLPALAPDQHTPSSNSKPQ